MFSRLIVLIFLLVQYEDVIEKFEEHKNEKEGEIKKLSDKVNTLEKGLHESTLKTTQLDGQLKLSNEKLKNCEGQVNDLFIYFLFWVFGQIFS